MTNFEMPPEVKEYFDNGCRTITKVVANDDYTLTLTFDNGEVRLYDMKPFLDTNAYRKLNDISFFNTAHIVLEYTVGWNDEIDICPDSAYQDSIPYNEVV